MTDREAMKMALEALEYYQEQTRPIHKTQETIAALRQALTQPEQETVCDKDPYLCGFVRCQLGKVCKNTAPPSKPWVSLTDDEKLTSIWRDGSFHHGVEWAEAKLKEKNT